MARPLILVLGGYGFIGAAIVRALDGAGFRVRALGRDPAWARGGPADWVLGDLSEMTDPTAWTGVLEGVEAVVNAAGGLQDGPRDRVPAVQARAVAAMAEAAGPAGVRRLVQISAVGARAGAGTAFLASKAVGDRAVRESGLAHVILRPGLVMGRTVYGGTGLLRMLAAVPLVQPLAYANAPIQVVDIDDVARAAVAAVRGELPGALEADLVAEPPVSLRALERYGLRVNRKRIHTSSFC